MQMSNIYIFWNHKYIFPLSHYLLYYFIKLSDCESLNIMSESCNSWCQRHVHEFRLCVHLKSSLDCFINFVVDCELFSLVLRISLEGCKYFRFLRVSEFLSWNDCNLLFLVEFLIKLTVSIGNLTNVYKSLILCQNLKELESDFTEWSCLSKGIIKLSNFLGTNSLILCEKTELFAVDVEFLKIFDVLENSIKLRWFWCICE